MAGKWEREPAVPLSAPALPLPLPVHPPLSSCEDEDGQIPIAKSIYTREPLCAFVLLLSFGL